MQTLFVFTSAVRGRMLFAVGSAILTSALFGTPVHAQKKALATDISLSTGTDPCKSEVLKFEETIGFIRQSQGNQAAEDLKKRLIPPEVEGRILATEGYCGLAKHIREKKLNR